MKIPDIEINQLPKDWKWVKLGEVCKLKNGFAFKSTEYKETGIPVIRISDIRAGTVKPDKSVRVLSKNEYEEYIVLENEILVAMSGATTGKFGIFRSKEKAYQNQRVGKFKILNENILNSEFLLYQLHSLKRQIEKDAYGGAQPNISSGKIEAMEILLPPKPTQLAIVSKIEELFSELDKGIENMRTAQQQLKIYRQAVLKCAFEGLFTKDWRTKNSNEKLAEAIIKQVLIEKEKIVKSNGLRLPVFEVVDKEEILLLPQLPNSWTWITPDVISSPEKYSIGIGPFGSNLKVSDYKTEGFPLVFVKNITRNDFTLNLKFISENKFRELNAHAIKPLDILITKMGDPPGDCAIYPANRPNAVITSDCLKFRVWDKFSNIKYFKYCLETNIIKKQLGLRTKGVAQKKISSSRFKTILFPFTNIEEQDEIVRQIESRLSVADKMEESITQSLQQAEALRQSILKKAFEGKL